MMESNATAPPPAPDRNAAYGGDVVILAGGLGTRIRQVLGETPKLLAPVGRRTVLDLMLENLQDQGVERVVLALGHQAAAVLSHLRDRPPRTTVLPVVEPAPCGTAGALRGLRGLLRPGPTVVMNGDTLTDIRLSGLLARHDRSRPWATLSCLNVPDTARFGRVTTTADDFVDRFAEKGCAGPGLISAGAYVLADEFLDHIAAGDAASLENDYFQTAPKGALAVWRAAGRFVDIGTPDGYAEGCRLFGGM